MNTCFLLLNNLLSSTQAWGGVATFLLLLLCFVGVHAAKLSSKGYLFYKQMKEYRDSAEQDERPKQNSVSTPKKPVQKRENAPAPVYYLVEKKRIRKQPTGYAEPKRIRFQNEQE
ncbi:MAG: hypothetical protein IKC91_05695 [Clostridia bacterium]|nr:hypothetical protein [Clostridia bacterium]